MQGGGGGRERERARAALKTPQKRRPKGEVGGKKEKIKQIFGGSKGECRTPNCQEGGGGVREQSEHRIGDNTAR